MMIQFQHPSSYIFIYTGYTDSLDILILFSHLKSSNIRKSTVPWSIINMLHIFYHCFTIIPVCKIRVQFAKPESCLQNPSPVCQTRVQFAKPKSSSQNPSPVCKIQVQFAKSKSSSIPGSILQNLSPVRKF